MAVDGILEAAFLLISDLIAIPDFSAGAMENWGLITYRMTAILYDKEVSSAHSAQWVATVIAHELAHQVTFDLLCDLCICFCIINYFVLIENLLRAFLVLINFVVGCL